MGKKSPTYGWGSTPRYSFNTAQAEGPVTSPVPKPTVKQSRSGEIPCADGNRERACFGIRVNAPGPGAYETESDLLINSPVMRSPRKMVFGSGPRRVKGSKPTNDAPGPGAYLSY